MYSKIDGAFDNFFIDDSFEVVEIVVARCDTYPVFEHGYLGGLEWLV